MPTISKAAARKADKAAARAGTKSPKVTGSNPVSSTAKTRQVHSTGLSTPPTGAIKGDGRRGLPKTGLR